MPRSKRKYKQRGGVNVALLYDFILVQNQDIDHHLHHPCRLIIKENLKKRLEIIKKTY